MASNHEHDSRYPIGIWDCLSSQQVTDFVRYHVSTGVDLTEIGEKMCDHCLAPDVDTGVIGCDNMTVLIVALLQGRTKEEWYSWMKDRVQKKYGYATPSSFPSLYPQGRGSFNAEAVTNRNSSRFQDDRPISFSSGAGLSSFARVFNGAGRVTSPWAHSFIGGNRNLMFGSDDSEDEDEETLIKDPFFTHTYSLGDQNHIQSSDSTQRLKAQLAEFERSVVEEDNAMWGTPQDGTEHQRETLQPLNHLPNGDTEIWVPSVQQLPSQPSGDTASPATKAEEFLDASEDPLKSHMSNS